jgi:hypothetical protein
MNPKGREYQGQYNDDDEEHGIGIYESMYAHNTKTNLYDACHTYAGQFNHNKAEGIGIKVYNVFNNENEVYCGEYKNNKRSGTGCTKFVTGGMFIGEHKNHIIDGFGVFITWEGLKFIGHCYDACPTLNGKWYDKNDNKINIIKLGYTPTGCKYSKDTKTWPTGAKYTGTMRNGKPHGLGTKIWENGNTYTGFWKDGKMEGQGNITYQFGDTYVGELKAGKRHGQGTYINRRLGEYGITKSGRRFVGEFKEDKEWNGNIWWDEKE